MTPFLHWSQYSFPIYVNDNIFLKAFQEEHNSKAPRS